MEIKTKKDKTALISCFNIETKTYLKQKISRIASGDFLF